MSERTSAEVERDVVAKRQAVEETLEALRSKLSSGQIVNSVVRSFAGAGGQGGELMGNLARQVRDNPLPVALTGVGLAWLLTSQALGRNGVRRADETPRSGEPTPYDQVRFVADRAAHGVEHAVRELIAGRYDLHGEALPEGALDEARIAADEELHGPAYVVRQLKAGHYRAPPPDTVTATYDRNLLTADELRFGAAYVNEKHLGGEPVEPVEPAEPAGTFDSAAKRFDLVGDRVIDFAESARDAGRRIHRDLDSYVSSQPLVSSIVGVALGVILGALLPWPPKDRRPGEGDRRR